MTARNAGYAVSLAAIIYAAGGKQNKSQLTSLERTLDFICGFDFQISSPFRAFLSSCSRFAKRENVCYHLHCIIGIHPIQTSTHREHVRDEEETAIAPFTLASMYKLHVFGKH